MLNKIEVGKNYQAKVLDHFVSKRDVILLSNNESQLFTDPEREYKVLDKFDGFFEHSSEEGEKYFRDKTAYVVEKA